MEKIVYLLSRDPKCDVDEWCISLRDTLPSDLRKFGAHSAILNFVDTDVGAADKLRQTCVIPAVDALVQVWVDSAVLMFRTALDAAISAYASYCHAYLVSESEPLANTVHVVANGARTPGFSQIAFLRRPANLAFEAWASLWLDSHTSVAIANPAVFEYRQDLVVRTLTPDAPRIDGIVEDGFPSEAMTDPLAFLGAPGDPHVAELYRTRMMESVVRFVEAGRIDVIPTSQYRFSFSD